MLKSLFHNVADLKACNFIKRDSDTDVFLSMLQIFKDTYREEYQRAAASDQKTEGFRDIKKRALGRKELNTKTISEKNRKIANNVNNFLNAKLSTF